jgi:hypothetical protein
MKDLSKIVTVACVAIASFTWLTAQAEPVVHAQRVANQTAQGGLAARSAGAFNGNNVNAAGNRRVLSDGDGNVNARANSAFATANGSSGSTSKRFTRNADGSASGERNTTATNANTGVTYEGSTTYTKGEGVSRSGGCTDASGNTVTCGSAR